MERLRFDPDTSKVVIDPHRELPVGVWWRKYHEARKELVKIMRTRADRYRVAAESARELTIMQVVMFDRCGLNEEN